MDLKVRAEGVNGFNLTGEAIEKLGFNRRLVMTNFPWWYTQRTITVQGRILPNVGDAANDETINTARWALTNATNPDAYQRFTASTESAGQVLSNRTFDSAFVVNYTERFSAQSGVGTFSATVRERAQTPTVVRTNQPAATAQNVLDRRNRLLETLERIERRLAVLREVDPVVYNMVSAQLVGLRRDLDLLNARFNTEGGTFLGWEAAAIAEITALQERADALLMKSCPFGDISNVERLTWQVVNNLPEVRAWNQQAVVDRVPVEGTMSVVDVRTGIRFNLQFHAYGNRHIDVEPPTREDTDAIFRAFGGRWSWASRPVWVTIGDRTIAAALHGQPHSSQLVPESVNGMNGHLCLHFEGSRVTNANQTASAQEAVREAWDAWNAIK